MAEILKPYDLNVIWAIDSSAVSVPGTTGGFDNTRIKEGWKVEIPPLEDFNFIDKRQDQFNAYLNQHGISEWDNATEYQANKSLTQINGVAYKALKTNINVNPINDTTGTWLQAFALLSDVQNSSKIRGRTYFTGQW